MPNDQPITQRIATKALIVDDKGRLLILREASTYQEGTNVGRYHFPGGRLNPGEAFLDGLTREVDEETGLKIEIGKPIYVGEWRPIINGVQNQIIAIFFICKAITKKVRLSEEHDNFVWIHPEETKNYDLMSPEDKVVEQYLASLN
jgi:8-oxo-dGTP diphosphatase